MGHAFICRRGGSGRLQLIVTADTGSTVTCVNKQSGISKSTVENNGTWIFKNLDPGTYTVTATLNGKTTSRDVVLAQPSVNLTYFAATIAVTYPAGATCVCSNEDNSITYTAPDTTGSYTFNVPNTGNWTISATANGKTARTVVNITGENTYAAVVVFALYLYNAGDVCASVTGGYTVQGLPPADTPASLGPPDITYDTNSMTMAGSTEYATNGGIVRTNSKIDLTNFSKLVFEGTRTGSASVSMNVWSDIGDNQSENRAKTMNITTAMQKAELDIGDLNGSYYVGFGFSRINTGQAVVTMTSLRLE